MQFTRLKESDDSRRQREELRVAELELMDHVEQVAALRRRLPADTLVDQYELIDVATGNRLSPMAGVEAETLICRRPRKARCLRR